MSKQSPSGARLSPFWTAQLLGWGLYALAKYALAGAAYPNVGRVLLLVSIGAAFSLPLRTLYRRLRKRGTSQPATIAVAVIASFVAANAWLLVYDGLLHWSGALRFEGWAAYSKGVINKSSVMLAWSALYLGIKHWQELQTERERALAALADAKGAQLQLLRYQLQPHFLFNALNSLRALIGEDTDKARQMVTELSGFLRYSLLPSSLTDVTLGDEIESLRQYLAIEQIRFERSLEVSFEVEPSAESLRVPGFLLHPLAENALKYGSRTSPAPLRVRVTASLDEDGAAAIEIANTGRWYAGNGGDAGTNGDESTGLGLANVRQRLEHLYPGRSRFDVTQDDGWVRARIEIAGGNGARA
jgi:signal transduction histidine kinase